MHVCMRECVRGGLTCLACALGFSASARLLISFVRRAGMPGVCVRVRFSARLLISFVRRAGMPGVCVCVRVSVKVRVSPVCVKCVKCVCVCVCEECV